MTDAETPPTNDSDQQSAADDFSQQAEEHQPGVLSEFWDFLRYNKRWWLTPIILVLLLLGLVAMFASGPAAPFIYTLF